MTSRTAAVRAHARAGLQRAWQRLITGTWPLFQQTVAATVAWVIAKGVIDHHEPFFAPIAAVVALNKPFGERGSNALRLLQGVVVGIAVGELTLASFGSGYGRLAIAMFVAMAVARATGGARVAVAQAAVAAILIVAVGNEETGIERLTDALVGAGVALVFTQFLFSPEPLRLLHRAESAALAEMAKGLRLTGQALADSDEQPAGQAPDTLRTLSDLSRDPGDLATRQGAGSRPLRMARQLTRDLSVRGSPTPGSPEEATVILTRIVAADIMIFSGADAGQATEAVLGGGGQLSMPENLEGPQKRPDR